MTFSGGFALLSAAIWIVAALVPLPKTVWLVALVGGGGPSRELDATLRRLRHQSCLNAAAAAFAAIAVLLQFK